MAKRLPSPGRGRILRFLIPVVVILLFLTSTIARYIVDYQWWREMGQVDTWLNKLLYGTVPVLVFTVLTYAIFWVAHAQGMRSAGTRLSMYPIYARIVSVALLVPAAMVAAATIDNWTVVLYFGGRRVPAQTATWSDPVFGRPLSFYLFELPFYEMLLGALLALTIVTGLVYWLTNRGWSFRYLAREKFASLDPRDLIAGILESRFVRGAITVFLVAMAARTFFERYDLLMNDHGFMVGVDYVDEYIHLPLKVAGIIACIGAAGLVWLGRVGLGAGLFFLPIVLEWIVPAAVHAFYVRPNEISIQRPYIKRHIDATRSAFGLDRRLKEIEFKTRPDARLDLVRHKALLDNVRLWDWDAFHDTVTQIQALRPYYAFADTDVDRYIIDGQLRQVLLTPREIDVRQLSPDARARWMNPHFIYTHGYGIVLAEANRITADGLPMLFIQDAPPEVKTPSLKITRPEIYYGELAHEPVFVRTAQPEFNYPSGSENVHSRYEGRGGFPISSPLMRLGAALAENDWNILLTGFLTPESRMMIHRRVKDRVRELAGFVQWDPDPYLVLTDSGRLTWIIDGYLTSQAHPYSRRVAVGDGAPANYIRNSVKATVDAYDGDAHLYIFDADDPLLHAYSRLFPTLLKPASEMPADLRRHARYPEAMFSAQAEIYRTFHMLDPDSFYNKEDAWNIARRTKGQQGEPSALQPTYVVATLPGESKPEFLLLLPFTPRNKDNLLGLMMARCDGEHLGELVTLQLSKQALVFGPMQIEARINQDQNISKDLTLWNQQGSKVVRGQILVLPLDDAFLYVEPIYIQASEARMPQLKKIAVAMGNTLAYSDTYDQAIAQLVRGEGPPLMTEQTTAPAGATGAAAGAPQGDAAKRLETIRTRLQRYRELAAQGKWAEAGKELEAVEAAAREK